MNTRGRVPIFYDQKRVAKNVSMGTESYICRLLRFKRRVKMEGSSCFDTTDDSTYSRGPETSAGIVPEPTCTHQDKRARVGDTEVHS